MARVERTGRSLLLLSAWTAACGAEAPASRDGVAQGAYCAAVLVDVRAERADRILGAINGTDDEHFYRVTAARRKLDGTILVADHGPPRLRAYRPSGKLAWSFGREGEGPGEFRSITRFWLFDGDTIALFDGLHMRLTVLTPDGGVVRVASVPGGRGSPVKGMLATDSAILTRGSPLGPRGTGLERPWMRVLRWSLASGEVVPIDSVQDRLRYSGEGRNDFMRAVPLSPEPVVATSPAGVAVLTTGEERRVAVRYDGTVRWISLVAPPVRVPDEVWEAQVDSLGARLPSALPAQYREELVEARQRILADVPVPETFPLFDDVVLGSGGWLAFALGGRRWLPDRIPDYELHSLAEDRTPLHLRLGPERRLLDLGPDHLVTLWRDTLEVEYVEVWEETYQRMTRDAECSPHT